MTDDLEKDMFDVFDEPQENRFHQTKQAIAGVVRDQFEDYDFARAVENLEEPRIPSMPGPYPVEGSEGDKFEWELAADKCLDSKYKIEQNLSKLYFTLLPRCTRKMTIALERRPDFKAIGEKRDGMALLKAIKTISFSYPYGIYPPLAAHYAEKEFLTFKQSPDMSLSEYMDEFNKRLEVWETVRGGKIAFLPDLSGKDGSEKEGAEGQSAEDFTYSYLAAAFMSQADPARFGLLLQDLHNNYISGSDRYPRTVFDAFQLLSHWTPPRGHSDNVRSHVKCFRCRQRGHYRIECPRNDFTGL